MPASTQDKVPLTCPHCGHKQLEPRTAISTVCKACRKHIRVQETLKPAPKVPDFAPQKRQVTCFDCGAELEVAPSAESTMCKRCSHYVDLKDYHITNAVSKNFKTKGAFVIDAKGYVFNTEAVVGHAVIKGRFHGKLIAAYSLTIYSGAEIKGGFGTEQLIIPPANQFAWKQPLQVGSADIGGELAASLHAKGTVVLRSTARLFGDLEAGSVVIEAGAVVVGHLRIGTGPQPGLRGKAAAA